MLLDREGGPTKRMFVVARAAVAAAKGAEFELAQVWVFVTVLASCRCTVKDAEQGRIMIRLSDRACGQ